MYRSELKEFNISINAYSLDHFEVVLHGMWKLGLYNTRIHGCWGIGWGSWGAFVVGWFGSMSFTLSLEFNFQYKKRKLS